MAQHQPYRQTDGGLTWLSKASLLRASHHETTYSLVRNSTPPYKKHNNLGTAQYSGKSKFVHWVIFCNIFLAIHANKEVFAFPTGVGNFV